MTERNPSVTSFVTSSHVAQAKWRPDSCSDSGVTMTKAPPGNRVTGFSRLINEKTMVREETPLDLAVEALCPRLACAEEEASFRELQPVVDKFLKELAVKMRHNTCHVLFDDPILLTNPEHLVWRRVQPLQDFNGIEFDVLLPIRRLPGTRIDHDLSEGYASVRINVVRFEDGSGSDNFEYVRSTNGKFLSPRAVCSIQQRIMLAAVKTLEARYKGAIVMNSLSEPDELNSFHLSVSLSEHYLSLSQDDNQEADDSKNKGKGKRKPDDDEDDDEDEEDEDNENDARRRKKKEEEKEEEEVVIVNYQKMHFRFIAGMNCMSKEKIYFTAQPYSHDIFNHKTDVWRYLYHMRESQILRPVFRADQGRRLRAMAGLVRLCAIEPDLSWVAEDHTRQIVLHQVQTEVDDVAKWQRLSLSQCIREMFLALRGFALQRNLPHYFIDGLNLLEGVGAEKLTKAMVRCSMLAKSESALARIANQASAMAWGRPLLGLDPPEDTEEATDGAEDVEEKVEKKEDEKDKEKEEKKTKKTRQ